MPPRLDIPRDVLAKARHAKAMNKNDPLLLMVARAIAKLTWFLTKTGIKYIVIPLVWSAILAALLDEATDRLESKAVEVEAHNGTQA